MRNSKPGSRGVIEYYESTGSRLGYRYILGGTKHFGFYAEGESRWHFGQAMRRMEDKLAEVLSLEPGRRVLDAGCGMGDVARRLAQRHGLLVHGIDILDFNVEEARKRSTKHGLDDSLSFEMMDYSRLTFPDDSFDGVYTMETLVHAEDSAEVLKGFYRVLKPGAKLVLFEYSHDDEDKMSMDARRALREVNELASMPSFQRFGPGVLVDELREAGFVGISAVEITENMMPMVSAFNTLARFPYGVARKLGRPHAFTNAMSAVEFWNIRANLHYEIFSARKPELG